MQRQGLGNCVLLAIAGFNGSALSAPCQQVWPAAQTALPVMLVQHAGADAVLLAVLAATGAGAIASQLPLIARNRHAAAQAEADRNFYK